MKYRDHVTRLGGAIWSRRWYVIGALGLCALALVLWKGANSPVVVTITTGGNRSAVSPATNGVHFTPVLPQRDADIETAGDHIAAASMYLKSRQNAAAIRSMNQARASTAHAIDRRRQQGKQFESLQETLKEIDAAEHSVRRGALGDARARLASLNGRLDNSLER
ncbi:MAG TPA: hypothetical protein VJ842_12595 [Pyrinomonadaceae bacterium]|nr:hypothetical protein [Pyrinomonadaceae bacterium]